MVRGRNRSLFWAFAMTALGVALSIPAIYLPVDGFLGGINLANIVLRLCFFGVFFLLAAKVAAAYNSPSALALIRGPVGVTALMLSIAGLALTYVLSDTNGSSTGMSEFMSQPPMQAYRWFGKLYLVYVAAVLVVPTWRGAFCRGRVMERSAAFSMCLGFLLVCSTAVLQTLSDSLGLLVEVLSYSSILFVALGLALIWWSFLRNPVEK
ncbi:hypothetical protein [Arthrobacter cryoconiti]|uniref:Uncharacterized protein n=1 Tax=Arthrobacter cryoconiti TaxID=748907 RepID=A0ABV8QZ56_9MICC|nr:hypothetical protein [Arthrobacter cryoconiti]MCC9068988.1 hypothetical protein [Arthrobacter cryoconiti]